MKTDGDSTVQKDLKNLCIASLQPEVKDQVPLDLYLNVSQNITISCHGSSEVHLSGYFEPNNSIEEQMFGAAGAQGFNIDDEEEEDEQMEMDELKGL